jgi:hypothetical protein
VSNERPRNKRQNTRLESEGAEFLVLGSLLVEGIDAYKSYRYMPGYDLVAVLPEKDATARIQVKSRWASDAAGYLIKNYDCDFVVFAQLNRGFRYKNNSDPSRWSEGRKQPEFYVFPVDIVKQNRDPKSKWGRVFLKKIPDYERFKERWDLIRSFLARSRERSCPTTSS